MYLVDTNIFLEILLDQERERYHRLFNMKFAIQCMNLASEKVVVR